jgi:hypothetical protein
MTILTFHPLSRNGPSTLIFRKLSNAQTFESPLSKSTQTMELPGARWALTATWDNLKSDDAAILRTFLTVLRGAAGRFYLGNPGQIAPRGTALAAGTPLVMGAGQSGSTLVTDQWTPGATLLAGDFIGFNAGTELRMVVTDATADGSGVMTLSLDAPIRTSPADNSAIITAAPTCIMRLSGNDVEWPYLAGGFASFTLDAVEAFA